MSDQETVAAAHARLDQLAEELAARGFGEFVDFYMPHRAEEGGSPLPASEIYGIRYDGDAAGFRVYYRDLGDKRVLLERASWEDARVLFTDAVERLVAQRRGRR